MQEHIEQDKVQWTRWMNKKALIPAGVCCFLILAALISGMVLYRNLPTAQWRESNTDFPWENHGVSVKQIKCNWKDSKGDARMELRAAFYPAAVITLGEKTTGKGYLIVRFLDDNSTPCGQTIYLPYDDNGFKFREEVNIVAMGKEATVHAEVGYRTKEEFYNHALSEARPLWKVCIWNRIEDAREDEFMGYITIPATDKAK